MPENKAKIRTAEIKDFDDVFLLLPQLWPDKELNKNNLNEVFSSGIGFPNYEYFCAEINGKVIGFCSLVIKNSLWYEGLLGYICELVIDNFYRRQGIGTALLKTAINKAKEKGCGRVELDSAFHREEAHKFYEKNGFEKRAYLFSKRVIKT